MFGFAARSRFADPGAGRTAWLAVRLWPDDHGQLAEHYKRLTAEDRRIRFGHVVSDRFLDNYARLALDGGNLVIGAQIDGMLRGVGEARSGIAGDNCMEAAFTVETGFKGRGMGGGLFAELMQAIADSGRHQVVMACIRSNSRMIALASKHGAVLMEDYPAGDGQASLATLGDEMVEDVLCLSLDLRNTPWSQAY